MTWLRAEGERRTCVARAAAIAVALASLAAAPEAATGAAGFTDREGAKQAYVLAEGLMGTPAGWTGSIKQCRVGQESERSREATLTVINILRRFAGLEPVTLSQEKSRKALAAALMMRAAGRNSHDPGKDWPCYTPEGAEAAGRSNLYLGLSGPAAMVGYVEDPGVRTLGHRRWLLDAAAVEFGTGSTGGSNALWVIGGPQRAVPSRHLTAWPAPGWFPWPWIFPAWSASIGGDLDRVSLAGARVSVAVDGQPAQVSQLEWLPGGYGTGATLSWRVKLPKGSRRADRVIEVEISNIAINGAPRTISYTVNAFTPPEDPLLDFFADKRRVCVETENPDPVQVVIARQDGGDERTLTIAKSGCRRFELPAGYWRLCASQAETRDFYGWSLCRKLTLRAKPKLRLARPSAKGGRVLFRLEAGPPLEGRRAKVRIIRKARKCGVWVYNEYGAPVKGCALRRASKRVRSIGLRSSQRIAVKRPRRGEVVQVIVRTRAFDRQNVPYAAAKTQAKYKRR